MFPKKVQKGAQAPVKTGGVRLHEADIAGVHWGLNNLDAETGLQVLMPILGMIGEPIGALAPSLAKQSAKTDAALEFEIPADALALALGALMRGIADPKTQAVEVIKALLTGLHKGKPLAPVDFNEEFASNYAVLLSVVSWAITINYGSFFGESPDAAGLISKLKTAVKAVSTPETSTGESTA